MKSDKKPEPAPLAPKPATGQGLSLNFGSNSKPTAPQPFGFGSIANKTPEQKPNIFNQQKADSGSASIFNTGNSTGGFGGFGSGGKQPTVAAQGGTQQQDTAPSLFGQ